jgi:hypothetical protein
MQQESSEVRIVNGLFVAPHGLNACAYLPGGVGVYVSNANLCFGEELAQFLRDQLWLAATIGLGGII